MDWLSLLVPFAYLGILLTSLATFSSLYRNRKARWSPSLLFSNPLSPRPPKKSNVQYSPFKYFPTDQTPEKSLSLAPYFAPHTPRNIYLSLLHLQDHDPSAAKVPDSLLRAALLARCTEDIHRIIHIRTRKQALNTLLKRGCVGDEIWQRLLRAEQELEAEVKDCVQEANAFGPNWGTTIFQSANEMANNDMLKKRLDAVFATLPEEKTAWEARRESMREGFMKELEGGKAADVVGNKKESAAKGSSDEDAVMVEKGGDAAASSVGAGGGVGKSKKKKGKR